MSSFFERLHHPSSGKAPITKTSSDPTAQRTKSSPLGSSTQVPRSKTEGLPSKSQNAPKSNGVQDVPRQAPHLNAPPSKRSEPMAMRRTQSSSASTTPIPKKRKGPPPTLKTTSVRNGSSGMFLSAQVKRRRTASPAYRLHRSSSDDETDFSEHVRIFRDETPDDPEHHPVERSMLNSRAGEGVDFLNAKELVCVVDKDSFFPEGPDKPALELTVQLPFGEETFKLLRPKKSDEYHPIGDIVDTVSHLLNYFLPSTVLPPDTSREDYLYRLSKGIKSPTPEQALPLLDRINSQIIDLRPFTPTVEKMSYMPRDLLQRICVQCYTRQVSPLVDGLKKYTAFSSTVYGELLFPFLSKLFTRLKLVPGNTFVDLGCGVGNCIIQASGETGCKAIGIEIMDHAANLGTDQVREFEARMRAWGLSHGPIQFIHGDMTTLESVPNILQHADVVLCNNYAFTAELNDALLRLFLDLPDGAKVISLKSFVPVAKDGRVRGGRGGVGEMFKVTKEWFGAGSVSWMPGGGEYYISTVSRIDSASATPASGDV